MGILDLLFSVKKTCPNCEGKGKVCSEEWEQVTDLTGKLVSVYSECYRCDGTGKIVED